MLPLSPEEEQALLRSVGTHRRDRRLSPAEVARLLQKAIDNGASKKKCAEYCQIGTTQITSFLNLLKLAPEIQHLADWSTTSGSTVSFSSLAQLAALKHKDDQISAATAILANRLSWKEVVQLVQLRNRSGKVMDECIRAVLKLRPRVTTRHIFIGSIASDDLKMVLSRLTQNKRDELLKRSLQKILGDTMHFDGRLGSDRFTIVGLADPSQTLGVSPDGLESLVNDALTGEAANR